MTYRMETDSLGDIEVPQNALYGSQTQRAINNFPLSGWRLPMEFIDSIVIIKHGAARANAELGILDKTKSEAIQKACLELLQGNYDAEFPVDVFQTGSGTSTNMNVNEVIANLCKRNFQVEIDAHDDANLCQSSNDVIPSAIHLASAMQIRKALLPKIARLNKAIKKKSSELKDVIKNGRTHLMDAMPIEFSQELSGWSSQLNSCVGRIEDCLTRIQTLALGGTAVGTGVAAHPDFAEKVIGHISEFTDIDFRICENRFEFISSQDTTLELSGHLKVLATALMKISNDLRWMNSGPISGLREIQLQALQPGSSIMPGKVNPVIPEATAMVSAQVIGLDAAITIAAQSGNFQLNTMLPMIAFNILKSIELLGNASEILGEAAINSFKVNEEAIVQRLNSNPILVTALTPYIGYSKAEEIVHESRKSGKSILETAKKLTNLDYELLTELLNPKNMTRPGEFKRKSEIKKK